MTSAGGYKYKYNVNNKKALLTIKTYANKCVFFLSSYYDLLLVLVVSEVTMQNHVYMRMNRHNQSSIRLEFVCIRVADKLFNM